MITLAICAIIKDTPDYLMKEWINHHFNLGVSGICVYVDVNSKPIYLDERVEYIYLDQETRDKLLEYGCKYGLRQNLATNIQIGVYNTFLTQHREDYDWIAFIDDDEFLEMNIEDLNDYQDETCVILPWKMMYTPDIKCQYSLKNYKPFPLSQKAINNYWKPIVNTKKIWLTRSIHHGDFAEVIFGHKELTKWWNSDYNGGFMYSPKFMQFIEDTCTSYIRHYKFRSFQEWIESIIDRGYVIYDGVSSLQWNRTIKLYFEANPYFKDIEYSKENVDKFLSEIGREDVKQTSYYDWIPLKLYDITGDINVVYNVNDAAPISDLELSELVLSSPCILIDYKSSPLYDNYIDKNDFFRYANIYAKQLSEKGLSINTKDKIIFTISAMFPKGKVHLYFNKVF